MNQDYSKSPRLYVSPNLSAGASIDLPDAQAHYLKNVMRMGINDSLRLFNGRDGEWHATITQLDKKHAQLTPLSLLRAQPVPRRPVHLLFSPIKKARMDWLVEKAVELGATDLHPVLTQHTEVRDLNPERINTQIIEAAEQCERLDIPTLHSLAPLKDKLSGWRTDFAVLLALERADAEPLATALDKIQGPLAFLIGPEGGFSAEERAYPSRWAFLKPVSLGPDILRSETAACFMLSQPRL
ncbi:MAG: 16S rRNA (uracil(1498)-N(3))-methyltransferase [Micavibrio sp.]